MAMFFNDQYVQLKGEEILIPPEVLNGKSELHTCFNNNKLYVNGYKYDNEKQEWIKSLYGKWLLIDMYSQFQITVASIYIIAIIIFFIIWKLIYGG